MYSILKKYFTPLPFLLLCLYVFFMFNAQATLFPTIIHTIVMYGMVVVTFTYSFFRCTFRLSKFSFWYLAFLMVCCISGALSINSDLHILFDITVSFIISFCFILTLNDSNKLDAIINVYIVSAVAMIFQIILSGQLDYLYSMAGTERLGTEISGNANIFSALCMYSGVFSAWSIVFSDGKLKKIIYFTLFILILFVMIISGGRKTIVAVLITFMFFLFFKVDKTNKRKIIRNALIAIISVLGFSVAVIKVPILYDLIGERFEGLFYMFSGQGAEVDGDEMRSRIFGLALNGWFEKPLFGHGIDSFKAYNRIITGHYYYAHNNYVELLYDIGLIGFIVFYWIYYYIIKHLKKLPFEMHKYKILAYGLLVELLLFDLGGVSYYLTGNIIILAIAYMCTTLKHSHV